MINTIRIIENSSKASIEIAKILRERLIRKSFNVTEENNADLIISVGGDGTFLKALQETNFNTQPVYVGILCGHLGFLQEINVEDIDIFLDNLKSSNYRIEKLNILNTVIKTEKGIYQFYSLNETVIREKELKALHINLMINDNLVEKFFGDGIIVSTPTGSTAYNLSAGGSIVYPELEVLQITHIAPINSAAYRSLNNSIIMPLKTKVCLIPAAGYSSDILATIDGNTETLEGVEKINIFSLNQIKTLKFNNYCFWSRIKEKFL